MESATNFGICFIMVLRLLPGVDIEIVAGEIGVDDLHDLLFAFFRKSGLIEHPEEAIADDLMGDDVVELLDVAIGCIDGLRMVCLTKVIDKLDAVVEIGDFMFLTIEVSGRTIGEDVTVKISVEVTGEVTAGEGKNNLVFEPGIDREGATGDLECAVILLLGIFQDRHELWRFKLKMVRSETIPDSGEEGLLFIKIGKGCSLFLEFLVALNGEPQGFLGVLAGVRRLVG